MSNSIYIDVNAKNASSINETNNRFSYRLPTALELPIGTEIGLQSSIINLKGINGASVELNEDIEETIAFQYYGVDTTYNSPVFQTEEAAATLLEYTLITDLGVRFSTNCINEFPNATGAVDLEQESNLSAAGYTENMMPLVANLDWGDGTFAAVPMTGKAKIKIKRGIYSINKISNIISEQINVNRIIGSQNQDFYEFQKLNKQFNGYNVNNSTNRNFVLQQSLYYDDIKTGFKNVNTDTAFIKLKRSEGQLGAVDFTQTRKGAATLDIERSGFCSIVGVSGNTNRTIRNNAAKGALGAGYAPPESNLANITLQTGIFSKYYMGFEASNKYTMPLMKRSLTTATYNPFLNGLAFGTTGFEIKYDDDNSGFSISKAHEGRKIPTIDRFGTTLESAGQECVFNKVVVPSQQGSQSDETTFTLNNIMSRISGILITNWAVDTCEKEGDVEDNFSNPALTADEKKSCREYRLFDDYFTSKDKARAAFNKTIWGRLGFQYDEIQNSSINGAGTNTEFWFGTTLNVDGFTTNQSIDSSIIPSISTLFNPLALSVSDKIPPDPSKKPTPMARGALPAVSDVQFYNLQGISVPVDSYNNNLNAASTVNVASYQGSFYRGAVMIPVITTAKDFTANNLPTLSENGYMLITSSIVEPNDTLKDQQTVGILDVIPKSNLSNQDYIADRNVLSHTLSNPKVINEIDIKILNPDMTDIPLQVDSSLLFKITFPVPKPTNVIENEAVNIKSEQVAGVVASVIQAETDKNVAQTNMRVDISNTQGEQDAGSDGVLPDELRQAQQAYVLQALDGDIEPDPDQPPLDFDYDDYGGGMYGDREDLADIGVLPRADPEAGFGADPFIAGQEQLAQREQAVVDADPDPPAQEDPVRDVLAEPAFFPDEEPKPSKPPRDFKRPPREVFREPAFFPDEEPKPSKPPRDERTFPRPQMTRGEEPRPERGGAPPTRIELRQERAESIKIREKAEGRIKQLESDRALAQGRQRAIGRKPKQQIELKRQIENYNAEINRQEAILRGYSQTPRTIRVRNRPRDIQPIARQTSARPRGETPAQRARAAGEGAAAAETRTIRVRTRRPPPPPPTGDD